MSLQWKRRKMMHMRAKKKEEDKAIAASLSEEYKETIRQEGYLGKKGYTIPKAVISEADMKYLYESLRVAPVTTGVVYNASQNDGAFPVYRENAKKIYIPRFYGIERYGVPHRCEIEEGDNIQVDFPKPLRDYQDKIVNVYMDHIGQPIAQGSEKKGNGGILEVPCGRGKCLGKDTPIMMYDGTVKPVQEVQQGDLIMGDDSTPRKVLSLARGRETMYKVVPKKGDPYVVNESHILSLKYSSTVNKGTVIDMPVTEYLQLPKSYHGNLVGYRVPVEFTYKPISIDPYLLGMWLGDGLTEDSSASHDIRTLCGLNNNNNKRIPHDYKCNDRETRMQVLAGLIDADGHYRDNCYEIVQKRETLLDDIIFIARSLGFAAYKKAHEPNFKTMIHGKGLEDIPVQCSRKKAHPRKLLRNVLNTHIRLEKMEEDDYYGFEIDGNRRFVLGDFTVTHNTVMALKIISQVQKKTLIIVHKEFLMNQWIERAEEFLPGVKIGKIQGPVFDVEGKDIVIGMLQTLYDRAFPENAFESFGLTVVDEVHRIGSEQFSKSLLRIVSPNMLGISATVDRKDKLTCVLHMFIGPKIYTEQRKDDDPVCVRALEYIATDPDFNETEYDFKGQAKYSTMITKLCNYGPRSDFIVKTLKDLLEESRANGDSAQIMVLAHNRSLLTYFYESIVHQGFATTGYYVGGMKQAHLQETEEKQIVLATYAMAAEALDIKSLSILVMASPKTDITQSVGRILRVRHDNPVVVDIVDRHEIFQNQWKQRRRFYKKCNYRILATDSIQYKTMTLDWKNDKTWRRVYEPTKNQHKSQNQNDDDEGTGGNPLLKKKCLINVSELEPTDE